MEHPSSSDSGKTAVSSGTEVHDTVHRYRHTQSIPSTIFSVACYQNIKEHKTRLVQSIRQRLVFPTKSWGERTSLWFSVCAAYKLDSLPPALMFHVSNVSTIWWRWLLSLRYTVHTTPSNSCLSRKGISLHLRKVIGEFLKFFLWEVGVRGRIIPLDLYAIHIPGSISVGRIYGFLSLVRDSWQFNLYFIPCGKWT